MTKDEQVHAFLSYAIVDYGFTKRQAEIMGLIAALIVGIMEGSATWDDERKAVVQVPFFRKH
jgi:hypothetical protein